MKVKMYVGTNVVGSMCEKVIDIPDKDFEGLTKIQTHQLIEEYLNEWIWEHIESGYEII